jgi:peptidyl-prolyl cis-trans isomerase SurA
MQKNAIILNYINMFLLSLVVFFFSCMISSAQQNEQVLDQIVAVIGDNVVLQSDIEEQYNQLRQQSGGRVNYKRCEIFEQYLVQKLMMDQAEIDSVTVTEDQVEMQMDQRLDYFAQLIGGRKSLEEYFNKSIAEIKEDFREMIREQLITQKMQEELTGNVNVTPSEIKKYYAGLPEDSIPYINSKIEVSQIVVYPRYDEASVEKVKVRLLEIRQRVIDGSSFKTQAVLYSQGPSATNGGELGFMGRGELAKAYADAAYKLKEGSISNVVETEFGFHIIQLVERRDNKLNTRHILMRPTYSTDSINNAREKLDSIVQMIRTTDTLSFALAARLYSEDEDTRNNGGLLYDPSSGQSDIEMDDLDATDLRMVKKLKTGQISDVYQSYDKNGRLVFKVIRLNDQTEPHLANLKKDYDFIKKLAEVQKKQKVLDKWVEEKLTTTYININGKWKECEFNYKGWLK